MKKEVKASATVEIALIIPIVFLMFVLIVFAIFYYHDKNIINAAAYESSVVASNKLHESDAITEEEIIALLKSRIGNKCILLSCENESVTITKDKVAIQVVASKGNMKTKIVQSAAVTKPERQIREIKKWKNTLP